MAKNMIYKYTENKTRTRTLAAPTEAGVLVLDPADGRPAVTLTATGELTRTISTSDNPMLIPLGGQVTSITYEDGSVGNDGNEATLAYDGTWEVPVPGSTTAVAQGDPVYIEADGDLSLTATGNTEIGFVDYPKDYYKRDGVLPVRIGA